MVTSFEDHGTLRLIRRITSDVRDRMLSLSKQTRSDRTATPTSEHPDVRIAVRTLRIVETELGLSSIWVRAELTSALTENLLLVTDSRAEMATPDILEDAAAKVLSMARDKQLSATDLDLADAIWSAYRLVDLPLPTLLEITSAIEFAHTGQRIDGFPITVQSISELCDLINSRPRQVAGGPPINMTEWCRVHGLHSTSDGHDIDWSSLPKFSPDEPFPESDRGVFERADHVVSWSANEVLIFDQPSDGLVYLFPRDAWLTFGPP